MVRRVVGESEELRDFTGESAGIGTTLCGGNDENARAVAPLLFSSVTISEMVNMKAGDSGRGTLRWPRPSESYMRRSPCEQRDAR